METFTPISPENLGPSSEPILNLKHYAPGTSVIYSLHGRCTVLAVETKKMGDESILFYKLEIQKTGSSHTTKQEPAIWLPVASAKERGLRLPMYLEIAEAALALLASREYYFQTNEPWSTVHPKLEACIRNEGGQGLAKVVSFLFVLKRKQVILPTETAKFYETVNKLLLRELSLALGESIRVLEEKINKSLKHKLIPDN